MGTQAPPPPRINDQNEYVSGQINHEISIESNDQFIHRPFDEKMEFYSDVISVMKKETIQKYYGRDDCLHCYSPDNDQIQHVDPSNQIGSISNRRNIHDVAQSYSGSSDHRPSLTAADDQPANQQQQQLVSVEINDKNEPLDDHELIINNNSNNTTSVMVPGIISSMFKENDIGKTAMGYVPSALVALLINTAAFPRSALLVVLIAFSVGFALIWNGIMLKNLFQRFGRVAEQAGVVMVFLGFFGLVASLLPLALLWAPLLCGVLFLLPFILRVLPASHCNLLLRTNSKRIGATSRRPPLLPINN